MNRAALLFTLFSPAGLLLPVGPTASAAEAASPPSRMSPTRASAGGKGLLPDPALLDGSTHAAEKKSALGMIGDFELPGDENARSGKVGGATSPGGAEAAPAGGGGGAVPPTAGDRSAGSRPEGKVAGGGAGGEKEVAAPGGAGVPAGVQVAELLGDPSGNPASGAAQKPGAVAIGDQAMRIPQQTGNAQVVGAQQVANVNTQVYEKGTGTGGRPPAGKGGPNRTEKGRVIPSGL